MISSDHHTEPFHNLNDRSEVNFFFRFGIGIVEPDWSAVDFCESRMILPKILRIC